MVFVKLPVDVEDASARLKACAQSLSDFQSSNFPAFIELENFTSCSYPLCLNSERHRIPVAISSFPGPSAPISLCDGLNVVTEMYFYFQASYEFGE